MIGKSSKDTITVKDVPAEAFIKAYAEQLKKAQKIKPIKDANLIKTGHAQELTPENEDWFFVRAAALARSLYLRPERGVGTLRHVYGRRHCSGHSKRHHAPGSGKVIRYALQQLQSADVLIAYNDKRNHDFKADGPSTTCYPRIVSSEGRKEMNLIAKTVYENLYLQA